MNLPENITVRRRHKLSEVEIRELNTWLETKIMAARRMRDANRRHTESNAIFEGTIAKIKWNLGWGDADSIIYNDDTGELLDLVPGVDEEGRCLSCGEKHSPDEDHG